MKKSESDRSYLTAYDLEMDSASIKLSFANHVEYSQGKDQYSATMLDYYFSAVQATRSRMLDRWNKTQQEYYRQDKKRVYYLSLEFLIGRLLVDGLINLGIQEPTRTALGELGLSLDEIEEVEWDAGLGNGGLGRLAACFMDSMATLGLPAMGYGIRYEYGIFRQLIVNGAQEEHPDNWLRYGNPWELPRPEVLFPIRFYGRVETSQDEEGRQVFRWVDGDVVMAMAYDILVPGYRNEVVNTLRLWSAKGTREFNLSYFNQGDYIGAVEEKNAMENISRVLYPDDTAYVGRELRLKQEYFFVSATLQDALRRHLKAHPDLRNLPDKVVFQLNDTHPAIAVAELMRLLIDGHGMDWEEAWDITTRCIAYTNHTILSEALEKWPVPLMESLLPRHLQIIYEINRRFLEQVRTDFPGSTDRISNLSLIEEGGDKKVRMANLAVVASFSVNGVSALHSDIVKTRLFSDFAEIYPERFNNKTNGITPRRWLLKCNPGLATLISSRIGEDWVRDLSRLEELTALADDPDFQAEWRAVKQANKQNLAEFVKRGGGPAIDPDALLDVQIKRIHEYKRQLLNIMHVIGLYHSYSESIPADAVPRTFLFAGKAAPGYYLAKLIIELIHGVAEKVNNDPKVSPYLKVVFLPNYGVSLAERIVPAAEISEQISTAGTEASGTGNMKLSLNGALTVGTLDGANIEIREAVGEENIFIFGHTYPEITALLQRGYDPYAVYRDDAELKAVLDAISYGTFAMSGLGRFQPLVDRILRDGDPYLVLADFAPYRDCQRQVAEVYRDQAEWTRRSIINVANMGRFSSDRTIAAYASEIWGVTA